MILQNAKVIMLKAFYIVYFTDKKDRLSVHMSFSTCILQNKQSGWCAFDANLELQFYPR